jgi:3-deoxy-7-phosphoheptulonate synthase
MMKITAPKEDLGTVIDKIHSKGCKHHEIWGSEMLAIGVTGQTTSLSEEEFLIMNSVEGVYRVSKPYKLVSREMKKDNYCRTLFRRKQAANL